MSVEVVAGARKSVRGRGAAFETICSICMGDAIAYHGGTLFCWACLEPLIRKGEAFIPSIEIKRGERGS